MRLFRSIPAAMVLLASQVALAQAWVEYVNREEFFSVNIPGQPVISETTHATATGEALPAKLFSVQNGQSRYEVTVVKFPRAEGLDVKAAIAHAAAGFRTSGGTITYDELGSTDGIEGHMQQLTNADKSRTFISMNLHLDRLYILEATVPAGAIVPGLFQQSLSVLDQKGERIRYQTGPDGKKYRVIPFTGGQPAPQ